MRTQGNLDKARVILQEAKNEYQKLENRLDALDCTLHLGEILLEMGQFPESAHLLRDAIVGFKEFNDLKSTTIASKALGDALVQDDRAADAIPVLIDAKTYFEDLENTREVAITYTILGSAYHVERNCQMALDVLEISRKMFVEIGEYERVDAEIQEVLEYMNE